MKRLTMCIITTLFFAIPASTQIDDFEIIYFKSIFANNPKERSIEKFDEYMKKLIRDELTRKGRKIFFTNKINAKWSKAIVINIYLLNDDVGLFVPMTYDRLPDWYLNEPIKKGSNNLNRQIVFLPPLIHSSFKLNISEGLEKAEKVCKLMKDYLMLSFLTTPPPR